MEDEDGYMVLGLRGKRGAVGNPDPLHHTEGSLRDPQGGLALAGAPRHGRCLLGAVTSALLLALIICVTLLVAERGRPKESAGCRNASLGHGGASVGCSRPELRKSLCPLQEAEGCKLCPTNWTLHGTKCYWVANEVRVWSASRDDCGSRGAELLMPEDRDELIFVKEILQKPTRYFWIGLSVPSGGQGWTWLNGSHLDPSRFQLTSSAEGKACGVLKGDRISAESCGSGLQWVCQKAATQL